jgi:integrase
MSAVYDVSLFNRDFKNRFISQYDESTQVSLSYVFRKAAELEYSLGKDVYDFNREELDNLFYVFDCKSKDSVASKISIVNKYIDFAIEQGFLKTGINLTKNFVGQEYYEKYISKIAERKKYLTKEQFENLLDFCVNDQDRAIFALLYEGARGRQEEENSLEELINLKLSDCNLETNEVKLTRNNGETRTIVVSNETMEILKFADAQKTYLRGNGEISEWMKAKKNDKMKLHQNGHILKPTGIADFGLISEQSIRQRITGIRKRYGMNPFITVANIWYSGMVEYGKKIKQEKGKDLEGEDYREICIRFGHDPVYYSKIKSRIEKYI